MSEDEKASWDCVIYNELGLAKAEGGASSQYVASQEIMQKNANVLC